MTYQRRQTHPVTVGDDRVGRITIGGDGPVSVQSMTSGYTHDVDGCLAEIEKLAAAGADIVRVAVPERKDTEALREIMKATPVPIVADVHFHYKRALEAVEAGVHKIRLNPGNINDRDQVNAVIDACKRPGSRSGWASTKARSSSGRTSRSGRRNSGRTSRDIARAICWRS